jgi:hypothetical protein
MRDECTATEGALSGGSRRTAVLRVSYWIATSRCGSHHSGLVDRDERVDAVAAAWIDLTRNEPDLPARPNR